MTNKLTTKKEKSSDGANLGLEKNAIYYFLFNYILKKRKNQEIIDFENGILDELDNFNLSYYEEDTILNLLDNREDFILKLIANCPYVEININNLNK